MKEEISSQNKPEEEITDEKGLFEDLLRDAFDLDKGLFATLITMFKNPGLVIDSYFTDRKRFTGPFRYALVFWQ